MTYFLLECAAERHDLKHWTVHLSNGKTIPVEQHPIHNEHEWAWKVDNQIFSGDESAVRYLKRLIAEKLTGKRNLPYSKGEVPHICGVNGAACRAPGRCNTALCDRCPVADQFFADRDGVVLIYAS